MLALPEQTVSYLTFDLGKNSQNAKAVSAWIAEFKLLYHEMVINEGLAGQVPSIAVFADHFTAEEEKQLRQVGAVFLTGPCLATTIARRLSN